MCTEKENATPEVKVSEQHFKSITKLIERINNHKPISHTEYYVSEIIENLEHLLESLH